MSARRPEPVPCLECGHRFSRDPVLEVTCPVCHQPPGSDCVVRAPSEHVKSAAFAGLPPWGHDARDLLACAEGHYGHDCKVSAEEQARRAERATAKLQPARVEVAAGQADLFAGAA